MWWKHAINNVHWARLLKQVQYNVRCNLNKYMHDNLQSVTSCAAEILTCHSRKSTGETPYCIGSVPRNLYTPTQFRVCQSPVQSFDTSPFCMLHQCLLVVGMSIRLYLQTLMNIWSNTFTVKSLIICCSILSTGWSWCV